MTTADGPAPSSPPLKRSPDDVLPPVEAPSAGFLVQLFLIPLLIVSIIISLWLLFSWLAHMGRDDPQTLVRELRRMDEGSWQRAFELANLLSSRDPRQDELRQDSGLAGELAGILAKDLDRPVTGDGDEARIKLRMFLCQALGRFRVLDGVPVLARAATQQEHPLEADVRLSALESLAVLADGVGPERLRAAPEVLPAVLACSQARASEGADGGEGYRPQAEVRAVAAFTLGVLGGDEARERLVRLLDDPYPNARYNAATGLCRQGDARAIPRLVEMLDPDNPEAVKDERFAAEHDPKRVQVIRSGIQAAQLLAETNREADLSPLVAALEKLAASDLTAIKTAGARSGLRVQAQETLQLLAARASR